MGEKISYKRRSIIHVPAFADPEFFFPVGGGGGGGVRGINVIAGGGGETIFSK